jgi:hypothetical protein
MKFGSEKSYVTKVSELSALTPALTPALSPRRGGAVTALSKATRIAASMSATNNGGSCCQTERTLALPLLGVRADVIHFSHD